MKNYRLFCRAFFPLPIFFLNCGCAPDIDSFMRNVRIDEHQATSNYSWCLSVKDRRVMGCLFPERNIAVRIEFPVGTHICTYLCMCTIACTHAKVWNESGDPKWLLPVASVGLMLHKLCHEVLVQLTNTCLSYQVHYFLINTWIFHFIMKKGVVFPIFQASEFSPSLIRSSGWMSDSVQWRKIVFPKSKQIFYYIKKATGYLFANEAILHYA